MIESLNSQTIPAWLVAITMIMTGLMWFLCIGKKIRVDIRAFASTFILEGFLYGVVYQFLNVDIEFRGFLSRLMLLILSWSQFLPLIVFYIRSLRDDIN